MSLNRVALMGRLVANPEVRYTNGDKPMCIARYRLAVNRDVKDKDGNYPADFISCTAFGKSGEFAEKHLKKGMQIVAEGRWETGSYTNREGTKVYTNDCIVQNQYFAESKQAGGTAPQNAPVPDGPDGFMNIPDGIDEELPFS